MANNYSIIDAGNVRRNMRSDDAGSELHTPHVVANTITPLIFNLNSAASVNSTLAKGSAGTLYSMVMTNFSAVVKFVKVYNRNAAPTVGTDIPIITVTVPANSTVDLEFGTIGKRFTVGIGVGITALGPDADVTAVGAGDIKLSLDYI